MNAMVYLTGMVTILGAVVGASLLVPVFTAYTISAPQQAAQASMAAAVVILPYCVFRVFDSWKEIDHAKEEEARKASEVDQP